MPIRLGNRCALRHKRKIAKRPAPCQRDSSRGTAAGRCAWDRWAHRPRGNRWWHLVALLQHGLPV